MVIPFPAYRPTSWELQLPNYRVITNSWRATEWPEILGSLPEDARLRLRYENITDAEALELLLLWRATAGGMYPLNPLPAEVAAGINSVALANRILNVAPLSWVVTGPPSQDSVKNLRSGLQIELRTELRFVPTISLPTITCPVYVEREYLGCLGEGEAPPPPPPPLPTAPDMWASRCVSSISNRTLFPTSGVICPDGSSYQVALVAMSASASLSDLYVIKRNLDGVVEWQTKVENVTFANFTNSVENHFTLCTGPDNEIYIASQQNSYYRRFAGDTLRDDSILFGGDIPRAPVWCFNSNGTLRWQRTYRHLTVVNPNTGLDTTRDQGFGRNYGRAYFTAAVFDAANSRLVLAGFAGRSDGGGGLTDEVAFAFTINPTNGALIAKRHFWTSQPETVNRPARIVGLRIRNEKLYLHGSCGYPGTSPFRGFVIELSLDLATIIDRRLIAGIELSAMTPAPDGGWYLMGKENGKPASVYKMTAGYSITWRQSAVGGGGFFAGIGGINASGFNNTYKHYSLGTEKDGAIVYGTRTGAGIPQVLNTSAQASRSVIFGRVDHETAKTTLTAVQVELIQNVIHVNTGQVGGPLQAYNATYNTGMAWAQGDASLPVNGRLTAHGFKCAYPDEGERWLDTGTNLNAAFAMVARARNNSQYQALLETTDVLPVVSAFAWPESINGIEEQDPAFTVNAGTLAFNHYIYNDPVYTAPTAAGSAGMGFYAGNNAVQRVSVERLFTPALILHANRGSGASCLIYSSALPTDQYTVWPTGERLSTVNGLLEYGSGFFRMSGRGTSNWNAIGQNYLALCLAIVANGYSRVAYTGDGSATRVIAHGLGVIPQFCFVTRNIAGEVAAGGSLVGADFYLDMRNTAVRTSGNRFQAFTSTDVTLGNTLSTNTNGTLYLAHFFASCPAWNIGTFQGAGSGLHTQNLGYQPRAILLKSIIGTTSNWRLVFRQDNTPGVPRRVSLEASSAEADDTEVAITSTGFTVAAGGIGNNGTTTALYFAIR